ncbi:MAG: hypothetical protein ACK56W_14600 [Pirellula sp.]|jgi:hypothetical protein
MTNSIKRISLVLLVLAMGCPLASTTHAEEWNWNPFAKSESKSKSKPSPLYTSTSSANKKSWMPEWKMPSMFSTKKTNVNSYTRKEPSTFQKMSKSTSQWFSKLNPFPKSTGYSAEPKRSWFAPKQDNEVKTVNDFLSQKMVQ